jgi:hypothetical protein
MGRHPAGTRTASRRDRIRPLRFPASSASSAAFTSQAILGTRRIFQPRLQRMADSRPMPRALRPVSPGQADQRRGQVRPRPISRWPRPPARRPHLGARPAIRPHPRITRNRASACLRGAQFLEQAVELQFLVNGFQGTGSGSCAFTDSSENSMGTAVAMVARRLLMRMRSTLFCKLSRYAFRSTSAARDGRFHRAEARSGRARPCRRCPARRECCRWRPLQSASRSPPAPAHAQEGSLTLAGPYHSSSLAGFSMETRSSPVASCPCRWRR